MKKLFFAAVMLMVSVATFAQNEVGKFTIMPKVGVNFADLAGADGSDMRIGAVAGVELEYGVTDMFGLSVGALYSMQGAKGKEDGATATLKADYINIPILANVYVAPGFAVKLGIQPGFNINSKAKVAEGSASAEVDASEYTNSVDFSIPVGVSYQFNNFVIDGRYNWGLNKVYKSESGFTDLKNSVFQITVGYKFAL